MGVSNLNGRVIWITGLSGAGKSSLAVEVVKRFRANGKAVVMLDGDQLREIFGATVVDSEKFNRNARLSLAMQYSHLCRAISTQGLTVVIATISLFKEVHLLNRKTLPGYFEVYLKVPMEELRRRDSKNIYYRFDTGEINNVAGLDLIVDEPNDADWTPEFDKRRSVKELADELLSLLSGKIL